MADNETYFRKLMKEDPDKAYELYAQTRDNRDGLSDALSEANRFADRYISNINFAMRMAAKGVDLEMLFDKYLNRK